MTQYLRLLAILLCLSLAPLSSSFADAEKDFERGLVADGKKDYAQATKWYRKAAEQGDAVAQYGLGNMYGLGLGVRQNYVTAFMWLNLAAAQGQKLAIGTRDIVAKLMTPQQISKVQTLAAACKARNYKDCYN